VAPDWSSPALRTVADSVIGLLSDGDCGAHVSPVTWRSGFGAGSPITWSSATCPAGAPVFAVNCRRSSAASSTVTIRSLASMRAEIGEVAERGEIYLAIDIDPVRML